MTRKHIRSRNEGILYGESDELARTEACSQSPTAIYYLNT